MPSLSKPFFDENNQAAFCGMGLFWVSTIGPLLSGNTLLLRLFIYPVYLVLLLLFSLKIFQLSKKKYLLPGCSYGLLSVLVCLFIICAFRGILQPITIENVRTLLFSRAGSVLVWLIPVAVLYGLSSHFWVYFLPLLPSIILIGMLYVFTCLTLGLSSGQMLTHKMYNSSDLLFLAPLLIVLAVQKIHRKNIVFGISAVMLLTIYMFAVGERFAIAFEGLLCVFYALFVLKQQKRLHIKLFIVASLMLIATAGGLFLNSSSYFQNQIQEYFYGGALLADTRGGGSLRRSVEQGMSAEEKVFGKGINGTYIWGYIGWPPEPYIRNNVEIGYMQIILKGGYLMLLCFVILSLYAVYLGLFHTNNKITKYLAYMILARLIIMFTAMIPRVGFEYFMFWLAIGGCLSSEVRQLTNNAFLSNLWKRKRIIRW